jgi:hypothetical protein
MMTITPVDALNKDFRKFVAKAAGDTLVVQKKLGIQLLAGVINKTPVDTGRARGNFQVSTTTAPQGIVAVPSSNESGDPGAAVGPGQKAFTDGVQKFAAANSPFGVFWVVNNLPYVAVLDQGGFEPKNPGPSKDPRKFRKGRILVKDGFSIQAPNGMVDLTIEEIRSQFINLDRTPTANDGGR